VYVSLSLSEGIQPYTDYISISYIAAQLVSDALLLSIIELFSGPQRNSGSQPSTIARCPFSQSKITNKRKSKIEIGRLCVCVCVLGHKVGHVREMMLISIRVGFYLFIERLALASTMQDSE
jgi:hypothetical protein